MVTTQGTLSVKTITGRYGPFNVGHLDCELGEFAIRDGLLDEYAEGSYQGTFGLKRIYSGSYQTRHRFIIETRAELAGIWLKDYEERYIEPDSLEADPIAEEHQAKQAEVTSAPPQPTCEPQTEQQSGMAALFGELWPLGQEIGALVKLTPEIGREKMGQQLRYLKREVHGQRLWQFEPKSQHWIRIGLDEEA
ncbi:DUF3275 family protein [Vibrio sp. 10N.261.46.A3]|uniref:DUF3275 family protein n=1 Tax=Vibrio sp. 10N.261.46.A3 TaxID=3229658 RepID=UPI00355070A6